MDVIRKFTVESKDIMFEGNGYSKEWEEESKRRGLRAVVNVPDAYDVYHEQQTLDLFAETGVLNRNEVEARYEVLNETYVKKLQIEARVIGDICLNHVLPAAVKYQNILIENVRESRRYSGMNIRICASLNSPRSRRYLHISMPSPGMWKNLWNLARKPTG